MRKFITFCLILVGLSVLALGVSYCSTSKYRPHPSRALDYYSISFKGNGIKDDTKTYTISSLTEFNYKTNELGNNFRTYAREKIPRTNKMIVGYKDYFASFGGNVIWGTYHPFFVSDTTNVRYPMEVTFSSEINSSGSYLKLTLYDVITGNVIKVVEPKTTFKAVTYSFSTAYEQVAFLVESSSSTATLFLKELTFKYFC